MFAVRENGENSADFAQELQLLDVNEALTARERARDLPRTGQRSSLSLRHCLSARR
jgi:hypothetical protein